MRPHDEEMERLEASLRAARPVAPPEFQARLDARVADGFRRFPRLRGLAGATIRWAHARLAVLARRTARRFHGVAAVAGESATQRRFTIVLWAAVAVAGMTVGSNIAIQSLHPIESGNPTPMRTSEVARSWVDRRANSPEHRRSTESRGGRVTPTVTAFGSAGDPRSEQTAPGEALSDEEWSEESQAGEMEEEAWEMEEEAETRTSNQANAAAEPR